MTTYGTISDAPPHLDQSSPGTAPPSPHGFFTRSLDRISFALSSLRPWQEIAPPAATFSLPPSLGEAYLRIRSNVSYFAANYAVAALSVTAIGLLRFPAHLAVFAALSAAWLLFAFNRDGGPLVILRRTIDERTVVMALSTATVVLLLFSGATWDIVVSAFLAVAVVLAHAGMKKTDELHVAEDGAVPGGWYSVVGEASATARS